MGLEGASFVERALRKLLLPVFFLTGAVVVSGFFFPEFVGNAVSGRDWLIISLLFFGSGLSYLAVLPATGGGGQQDGAPTPAAYLMRIRRLSFRQTVRTFLTRHDAITFGVPVVAFGLFFLAQFLVPDATVSAVDTVQSTVTSAFGWLLAGVMLVSVGYCLVLLLGPWGDIRLGGPDAEPAYTYPVYFTMFFAAGIAAGIVFWGPAEAIFHYNEPPPLFGAEPRSGAAMGDALTYALFHWGFSAWSAYIVIGLPIAYFVYQHDAPLRVSTLLAPYLGVDGLDSIWCRLVDMLAIFATIGGIATSVALVSQQFLTGIDYQWGVEVGAAGPILFVTGLVLIFVLSAQSGVHRGIRRIAVANVVLFGLFALVMFAIGPRTAITEHSAEALGSYAVYFIPMSLEFSGEWVTDWTIWNWAWWFSWAPFAGLFLAALSRGRTVRTVVFTGFVATSLATIAWFLLLGTTSLQFQHTGEADILASIAEFGNDEAVAGFPLFSALPLSQLLIFLFLALIIMFIASSADTSTLVVAVLASERGYSPTVGTIVFWGVVQGVVAVTAIVTATETTLQAAAVVTGLPFAAIALLAMAGLCHAFYHDEEGGESVVEKLPSLPFEDAWEK